MVLVWSCLFVFPPLMPSENQQLIRYYLISGPWSLTGDIPTALTRSVFVAHKPLDIQGCIQTSVSLSGHMGGW